MKESFILHTDALQAIEKLNMNQRGLLFTALMKYQSDQELPELDAVTDMAFEFIRAQMDRDNEKYDRIIEKRREAGRKSAEARKNQQVLTSVNHTDTVTDTVTDTDINISLNMPDGMAEELRRLYGDRVDGLIEDVRRYYTTHREKAFPGWEIAIAQFNSNQARWNAGKIKKKQKSIEELAAEVFADMEEK